MQLWYLWSELMAITKALEEWRPESNGAKYQLQLLTDHKNLEYFRTKKPLNCQEAPWSEFLTHLTIRLSSDLGNQMATPMLWRGGQKTPLRGGHERWNNIEQADLQTENLPEQLHLLAKSPLGQGCASESPHADQPYNGNRLVEILPEAVRIWGDHAESPVVECMEQDGRIQYWGKCYISDNGQLTWHLVQDHYHTELAGHPGSAKMFYLFDTHYYCNDIAIRWINMCRIVTTAHSPRVYDDQ